jgi:hypothetical protein
MLAELTNPPPTPSSKQFATWHHLRRMRQLSAAGELSWGTTRVAKHDISVSRNLLQHHSEQGKLPACSTSSRRRTPGVEIESCSTGGARVDLGILELTERIWASDCNDALERQSIQRWSGLVLPPELVGGHIGPTTSQTTARTHDLSFRAITALFGQFGTARARTRTEGLRNLSRNPGRTQTKNIILRGRTSKRA